MKSVQMKLEPAKYSVNGRRKLSRKIYNQRYLFLMLLPAVILVFVFSYVVLSGWLIAFINYRPGFNILRSPWIGFEQFKVFLTQSQDYSYLLRNTLIMNIGSLITNLFTAFIFAILLNEVRSRLFGKIVQTVTFFPFFVSWVIIYSLVNALFAPSTGAINETLVNWGVLNEGLNLLGDKSYSWGMMILLDAWKTLGYNSVIFLAAIAGVSPDEYEAAEIDGANRFQKIVYVLIPNLMPTVIVLLILNSGWILNSNFEQFFLFTNTTNWETMEVFDMYVYKFGLKLLNYPYATAVGILKSIVSLLILIAVNAISKKSTGRSII